MMSEKTSPETLTENEASIYKKLSSSMFYIQLYSQKKIQELFKRFGITVNHFNVLKILEAHTEEAINLKQISSLVLDENVNVSRLVDKLFQAELITKTTHLHDKRNALVSLSEKGKEFILNVEIESDKVIKQYEVLSSEEATTLKDLVDKLLILWSAKMPQNGYPIPKLS